MQDAFMLTPNITPFLPNPPSLRNETDLRTSIELPYPELEYLSE